MAAEERDLLRARRVLRIIRVVFYSGAAVAAVLLLHARAHDGIPPAPTNVTGSTSQGFYLAGGLQLERVHSFGTTVEANCSDVRWSSGRWFVYDLPATPFQRHGSDMSTRATRHVAGEWVADEILTVHAHVQSGHSLTGTVELDVHIIAPRQEDCHSGPISFYALPRL